jgi:hypothetical protein
VSNFEPPYRRYAIRCLHRGDGHESWFTDDGTGCDEAIDYTAWDEERLVTFVDRADAQSFVDDRTYFAQERKMTLRVMVVWEYPGGRFERKKLDE